MSPTKPIIPPEVEPETTQEQASRDARGRWRKGAPSPNPGGRPRSAAEVRELAQEHSAEAIEKLVALMGCGKPEVEVRACAELLDRAIGRPPQSLAIDAQAAGLVGIIELPAEDPLPTAPALEASPLPAAAAPCAQEPAQAAQQAVAQPARKLPPSALDAREVAAMLEGYANAGGPRR